MDNFFSSNPGLNSSTTIKSSNNISSVPLIHVPTAASDSPADPSTSMNRNISSRSKSSGLSLPTGSSEYGKLNSSSSIKSSTSSDFLYSKQQQYLSRATSLDQMDIQAALDQMRTILSLTPQRVYKTSYYRKQTKNQWSRDDPAFCVLEVVFLTVASVAYCVAFRQPNMILATVTFILQHVVGVFFGCGALVATIGQVLSNKYLSHQNNGGGAANTTTAGSTHHVQQRVEWMYAFDIHCNAFLPFFVILYALQFFLLPFVLGKSMFALILSNTLYAVAFSCYFYITHLGYRALPFLTNTEVFLFPIVAVFMLYILNFVGHPFGLGFNASRLMAHLFFD